MHHNRDIAALHALLESTAVLLGNRELRFDAEEAAWALSTPTGELLQVQVAPPGILARLTLAGGGGKADYPGILAAAASLEAGMMPAISPDGELALQWQVPDTRLEPSQLAAGISELQEAAAAWLAAAGTALYESAIR